MNPDVAAAIPPLIEGGVLPAEKAPILLREARGDLVGVRAELRALLYFGVLVTMAGVGLLVHENLDRIGPLAIAIGLGTAAAIALGWVIKVAPPFSWLEVPSPKLAFDYVLLLGVLLAGADLAFVEVKFAPLGVFQAWHLLIVALLAGLAAFRFDSRIVFSLALSSFAAWRGVSLARPDLLGWMFRGVMRWNEIACGLFFALLGFALARSHHKAHFEPVAVNLGWLLVLFGIASGFGEPNGQGIAYGGVLLMVSLGLAIGAFRASRFPLFAYGVVAGYIGLCRMLGELPGAAALGCLWFSVTSLMVLGGLIVGQRAMRKDPVH